MIKIMKFHLNFLKKKMSSNNPNLDSVKVEVHTKFGQVLSMRSQDIEQKKKSDFIQRPYLHQNFAKHDGSQSKARSTPSKFCQNKWRVTIPSQILSVLMCIQNLVRFCEFILKILSGNKILMSIKARNSGKILQKMTGNNPKLDLVNDDVHSKFGKIL